MRALLPSEIDVIRAAAVRHPDDVDLCALANAMTPPRRRGRPRGAPSDAISKARTIRFAQALRRRWKRHPLAEATSLAALLDDPDPRFQLEVHPSEGCFAVAAKFASALGLHRYGEDEIWNAVVNNSRSKPIRAALKKIPGTKFN